MEDGRQFVTTTFVDDFSQAIQEACENRPETLGRRDEERQYLIKPAPNAIRWCVDPQYADSAELYKYQRSYQIIRDVFQLRCPICNRTSPDAWGKSPAELAKEILLEWDPKLQEDVCPCCETPRSDFEADGALHPINALHLVCGQRSGKSVTAALIGAYVEHRILTIGHGTPGGLHAYFGLTIKDPFEMTFLASNEVQGKDTIWAKYRAFRANSPWFKRYVAWVKEEEARQDTPPGMERWVYREADKKIVNEHPDLKVIINSLNSNSAGLRGRTRLFGGLDEVSFMQAGDSNQSGDEIYVAIDNSLQTIRSRTKSQQGLSWLGLMCSVTSPRSRDDKGMRLLREAPKVPGMLAYHYPTWEFNPFEPRENFAAIYAKDPVRAERDFGANPPNAANPLIWDVRRFRDLVCAPDLEAPCDFDTPLFEENGHLYVGIRVQNPKPRFHVGAMRDPSTNRQKRVAHFVAFDAGKNFDAFSGACAHGEVVIDEFTGAQRIVTVYDWIFRILPDRGTEVYYDDVYGVVKEMMQFTPFQRIEFDRWNSTQLIQQIRRLGIPAEQKSLKNEDWIRFRQDAYSGLIQMFPPWAADFDTETGEFVTDPPQMHPHTCAIYELEGLEEDPDTQKVYNARKGLERGYNSNDTAQVVVHVNKMVQEAGYTQKDGDRSREAAKRRSEGDGIDYIQGNQGGVYNTMKMGGGSSMRNWGTGRGW